MIVTTSTRASKESEEELCIFFPFSRRIKLNGKVLEMGPGSFFPTFQPIRIPRANQVILPPLTYAFYVVPEANAEACLESTKKRP